MRKLIFAAGILAGAMVLGTPAEASSSKQKTTGRDCGSFLECLFGGHKTTGNSRNGQSGANSSSPNYSVPDRATAQTVAWPDAKKYAPGSLIVRTPERRLYYVLGDGKAVRYKIGVGREGFQWGGKSKIVAKRQWPDWRPPKEMIAREAAKGHELPDLMEGGPDNPLGARAMYIGGTIYRIHGTNNPASIGGSVSSGCIRMMNTDVTELYDKVRIGAPVIVYQ